MATGDTAIHRLDPRAKVLATLVFVVTVVSFGKYEVTALVPFLLFPVAMVALGNLPVSYIIKKLNEKLDARGKELEDLDAGEFLDLAAECRMNVVPISSKRS